MALVVATLAGGGRSPCAFCLRLPDDQPSSSLLPRSFWDWEKGEKLDYFHNGNPRYTRVTAMEYLNGQDCSLLLTATGEWALWGRVPTPSMETPAHIHTRPFLILIVLLPRGHCSQEQPPSPRTREVLEGTGFAHKQGKQGDQCRGCPGTVSCSGQDLP